MTSAKPKTKRIYLVNRDFQLRYIRLAVLVGLCSTLLTVGLILFPLVQFRIIRFPNFLPDPFLWAIGGAALLNFFIVAMMGMFVTHRIAGPMFSMTRQMHVMQSSRKLEFVRIRASDDLKYLVRSFNNYVEFLREQTTSDLAAVDELLGHLPEQGASDPAAVREVAQKLRQELGRRL